MLRANPVTIPTLVRRLRSSWDMGMQRKPIFRYTRKIKKMREGRAEERLKH